MRRALLVPLFTFVLFAAGCGAPKPPPGWGQKQTGGGLGGTTRLVLFSAGYCTTCKSRFPELQQELDRLDGHLKRNLTVEMHLTAGSQSFQKPTQELADHYRDLYHLDAVAYPDVRWKFFKEMLGNPPTQEVPVAIVIEPTGERTVFFSGDAVFVPAEIAGRVQDSLERAEKM